MTNRDKYGPLRDWLNRQPAQVRRVTCTFHQIEEMIGEPLPPYARDQKGHISFWSNTTNRRKHAQAWTSAGWEREAVDLDNEMITFVRAAAQPGQGGR